MAQFDMVFPASLSEASAALGKRGAVALAGATDLIPSIRKREIAPRLLVNLKAIPGLAGIERVRGGVRIGALTTVGELLHSDIIASDLPLLAEVARDFASVQIRNLATVGGNLCTAAPSADLALPLLALDARLHIRGPRRTRTIELASFFLGVNKTALRRGEILTAITVPPPRRRTGAAHAKLAIRQAMDLAFVGVAAAVQLAPDGRTCRAARIALGSVAPTPMRARKAEALLEGQPLTNELIAQAAAAAAAESRPITDLRASKEYRRQMVAVLARRVLREALRRARKEGS
ncbi:MAG: xanthine dehydrogenase family protein subunit M [Armatimonadota bacterium]